MIDAGGAVQGQKLTVAVLSEGIAAFFPAVRIGRGQVFSLVIGIDLIMAVRRAAYDRIVISQPAYIVLIKNVYKSLTFALIRSSLLIKPAEIITLRSIPLFSGERDNMIRRY